MHSILRAQALWQLVTAMCHLWRRRMPVDGQESIRCMCSEVV
jgi:hypothetical protein